MDRLSPDAGDTLDAPQRCALADLLDRSAPEIERRWLDRLMADLRGRELSLTELRDGIGDYIRALAHMLRRGESVESGGGATWARVAADHGITRVRHGFDIDELVHEFIVLR